MTKQKTDEILAVIERGGIVLNTANVTESE